MLEPTSLRHVIKIVRIASYPIKCQIRKVRYLIVRVLGIFIPVVILIIYVFCSLDYNLWGKRNFMWTNGALYEQSVCEGKSN